MMYSKRRLPDIEQWGQSSGSNVIPRRARPGLAGLRPHSARLGDDDVGVRRLGHQPQRTHPPAQTPVSSTFEIVNFAHFYIFGVERKWRDLPTETTTFGR